MLKENDKIKVHIIDVNGYRGEIRTRNYGQIFTIEKHPATKELAIEWNEFSEDKNNRLLPLSHFSWNVLFEDVETGAFYHFDQISQGIKELYPDNPDDERLKNACSVAA